MYVLCTYVHNINLYYPKIKIATLSYLRRLLESTEMSNFSVYPDMVPALTRFATIISSTYWYSKRNLLG